MEIMKENMVKLTSFYDPFYANFMKSEKLQNSPPSMIHLENSQKVGLCRFLPSTAIGAPAFFLQRIIFFEEKGKRQCFLLKSSVKIK